MAGSDLNMSHRDRSILSLDDPGERPRVLLPRSRPRVNLPTMSPPPCSTLPARSYHSAAAEPIVESAVNFFPHLGAPTPHVNIPINAERHVPYTSEGSLRSTSDGFENHLRAMGLSNVARQDFLSQGHFSDQSASRRPNQAQRRQQNFHPNTAASSDSFPWQTTQLVPPHLRGPAPYGEPRMSSNLASQTSIAQDRPFIRPSTLHGQLYSPEPSRRQTNQNSHFEGYSPRIPIQVQIDYLDRIALKEVPKVEITREEFAQKHALRLSLEDVCRNAVATYEVQKDRDFVAETVELKCFGSLSTTFATRSSDMDLVLLSPLSRPELSSPDSELPRLIEKRLLECGYGARLLTKTRVPIIRFCEKPTEDLAMLLKKERMKWEKEVDAVHSLPEVMPKPKQKKKESVGSDLTTTPAQPDDTGNGESSGGARTSSTNVKWETPALPEGRQSSEKHIQSQGGMYPASMGKQGDDPTLAEKSDAELTRLYKLAMLEGWYEPAERRTITTFIEATQTKGASEDDKSIARSQLQKLPNIIGRYRAPPEAHPLDFPKDGVGIQCDINFSNQLALHNSHLLKCYSLCDPRVRRMVLFVKAWSKKRKINSPYHGTLSSYGYVLMVLHYLVNIAQPPVVPNLQRISQAFEDELSSKETILDGHDIRFFRNESAIEELRRRKEITKNEESLGSLLHGFFHYYAHTGYRSPAGGFQWTTDTLSLRTVGGVVSKQLKGWTGAKTETVRLSGPGPSQTKEIRQRYLFAIEDPFEIEHNIARTVVHNGIVAIRDEFRRASRMIENVGFMLGKGEEALFREAEDKENLQYRAFGPRPRKDAEVGKETNKDDEAKKSGSNGRAATTAPATRNAEGAKPQAQQLKHGGPQPRKDCKTGKEAQKNRKGQMSGGNGKAATTASATHSARTQAQQQKQGVPS